MQIKTKLAARNIFIALAMLIFWINILRSSETKELVLNILLFVFTTLFGIILVRSTSKEINALHELSALKSDLISITSHQLRTPLSIMKGYLSMLKEGSFGKLDSKQLNIINKSYTTNEGMIRLVNSFLDLSHHEKGILKYNFKKTDLRNIVNTTVNNFKIDAERKNLSINWVAPKKPIYANIDEEKLKHAMANIIDNSIKYTKKGGISIRLVQETEFSKTVKIYISDTGMGVTKEEIETIFKSFARSERGEKMNVVGAGLGLHVAKIITEGHNGKIWVQSNGEDKGSTFIIELPLQQNYEKKNLYK